MRTMRLVCCLLAALVLTARVDAAGFAMSDNFTVFTPPIPTQQDAEAYAHEVLQSAEAWRRAIAKEWLSEELPPSVGQTTINVSFSEEKDSGLTWAKDNPQRKFHTLYLTTTPDRALGSTMAHEMVHVVLATQYPHPHRLAAWLEEGIACRYDDGPGKATRKRIVSWIVKTGNWPDLEELLNSPTIASRDKAAYAAAASLTEFLLTRGDKRTLLEFGQHAGKAGWDAALRQYYRINSAADLQRSWQQWVQQSPAQP
jgi:hypothetical protein